MKHTMHETGIYTSFFSPTSCRSAATSKVIVRGINIETTLKSSKWSTNFIFKKFFLKDILQAYPEFL